MNLKRNSIIGSVVLLAAALVAVAAMATASGSTGSAKTVKTGHALGKTVLVNRAGRTLYTLTAETKGRFICTSSCVTTWHPLLARKGQKPTGAHSLGTIRRPEGSIQVTYKGKPLYTFAGDQKSGDAKGEGFKDVGVWHAAVVGASTNSAPSMPQQTTTTSPGGYGY
jgi:predicted lipoprotein with Yx(FWY)xxD motif